MESDLQKATGEGIAQQAKVVESLVTGLKYKPGGKDLKGFDCSGYVSYVLKDLFPHLGSGFYLTAAGFTTSSMFEEVQVPKAGDLVFFHKTPNYPNHVGIVLNSKEWIGSQSSTGVKSVLFTNSFWSVRATQYFRYKGSSPKAVTGYFNACGAHFA